MRNTRPIALLLGLTGGVLVAAPFDTAGASEGFGFEVGVTVVTQAADDSATNAELTASGDLFISLGRASGEWLMYVEASSTPDRDGVSSFYPTVNADAHSVLRRSGGGGVQVSEFNYTAFLSEHDSLMLGLIDPSAWMDRGRIANDENVHFLNGSFVNNATIAFPDYTIGAVYRRKGMSRLPEITAIVTGSSGIADLPERSYQSLLNLFDDDRGVFAGAGASWLNERSSWRVGGWLRSDQQPVIDGADGTEMNYGVYGVFGWQSGASSWIARIGFANEDLSVATRFAGIAYLRRFRLGTLGVGVAHTEIAQDLRAGELDPALDSEVFFRFPVGNNAHITPSIQYVSNPFPEPGIEADTADAVVAGLRFRWSY